MSEYQQQSLLDLAGGRAARDQGIETIEAHRLSDVERVKKIIAFLLAHNASITADDVRRHIDFDPSHPNVIGAAFQSLARSKQIVKDGYTQSEAKARHAGMIVRWRAA